MRYYSTSLILAIAISVLIGSRVNAQAIVVENETTYVYVDGSTGSDSNSGALNSPFKTIQAAINKANSFNRASTGVKVVVNPGIYREYVVIAGYSITPAPLTVEAATSGTAIIAGSDVLSGWTQESPTVYSTSWTADLGVCPLPSGWPSNFAPIARRAEMVFVDGVPLTEVMSYADLQPGTFFADDVAKMMYISPSDSTNMATAVVEAATRPYTINVSNRTNVVLRGLVFRHAANCLNSSGAAINASNNVLVDGVQALWNNWGGFGVFSSSNVTVQNSVANYNGGVGFMGNQDQTTVFNFNESDYNNWRGAQAAFYDWGMGGVKLFAMRSTTVQNHFSYNNQAQGLWFDTDNANITIDNANLSGNLLAALQIERNEGPISVKDSSLCSNGAGVNILTSQKLTVSNNTFYNNGGTDRTNQAAIFVSGKAGGIFVSDWQTGEVYDLFTTGTTLQGNTILDGAAGQFGFGTYLAGSDWTQFATTLTAGNNTWYDPTNVNSFKLVNGQKVNLQGWQAAVSSDYSSTWSMPATSPVAACTPPSPDYADFSIDVNNCGYTMASGQAVATIHVKSFGYGAVNLQVEGVPTGVTANLSQQNLVSGTATLTFTSSMAAVAQSVPITIWASSGSRVHSVTFYLQVYPFQFTPVITWAAPQAVGYGTALSASQLNATLNVPGTCSYTPAVGTVLAAGTRTLTVNCTPADTVNYSTPAPVSVSLTVAKASLTITASSPTVAYHSAVPAITPIFTGFVSSDNSASMSIAPKCSTTYGTTSAAGSSPSTSCWGAAAANYSISYVPGKVTITPAAQTITFNPTAASVSYGVAPIALSASSTSGLAITFTGTPGICSVSGTTLTIVGAGACTVTASQAGNSNYSAAPAVVRTITVNPASLIITASSPTVVYGSPVPTISASFSGFVNGNSSASLTTGPTCTTAYITTSAVGSTPAANCAGAASPNYAISYVSGSVTITKAAQSITLGQAPAPVTYGVSIITLSATATSGLPVTFTGTPGICTASGTALAVVGAGTCKVTMTQAGNTNFCAAAPIVFNLIVNPAPLTITASSSTVVYGSPVPTIIPSYAGFVNGDTGASLSVAPHCSTSYTTTSAVGSFPATTCSGAGSGNYSISYLPGIVTITPSTLPVTATPVISLASGTYTGAQSASISDATSGATIYYTIDGTTPSTASNVYTGPIAVPGSMTLNAIALAGGYTLSPSATATYTITLPPIDFSNGFISNSGVQLNGKSSLAGKTLQLTDGGANEASSAFFSTPVNVAKFSTSFTIQQSSASGDGMMFVIQNAAAAAKAVGPAGSSLGYSYGPTQPGAILNSLGVKFDLYSNGGEGGNSTGLYLSGARPTTPAVDLTPSGIDLHREHPMTVQLTYDGTVLAMTIVDTITHSSYSTNWTVNIPQIIGAQTGYVGFTASTGGATAIQQVLNWKF